MVSGDGGGGGVDVKILKVCRRRSYQNWVSANKGEGAPNFGHLIKCNIKWPLHENNMGHSIAVEKYIGSLVLNPLQNWSLFFNQFNSLSVQTNLHHDDIDKINNCKYYDPNTKNTWKLFKNVPQ